MKRLAEQAAYIATLEPDFQRLSDDELAAKTDEFRQRLAERRGAREPPLRGVRRGARGASARVGPADLRRPDDGRDRPARGRHRRDEDRRGKDVRREPAALPERADRYRCPSRHRQRLPRPARRRMEPRRLRAPRHDGRVHREQRCRSRSARPPTTPTSPTARTPSSGSTTSATTCRSASKASCSAGMRYAIVDEVDSILDRRGAHAADHLRRADDRGEDLLRLRAHRQGARRRTSRRAPSSRTRRSQQRARLPVRREAQDGRAERVGHREGRARARDRQPLQPEQRAARQPPDPGAEGAGALQARRRLRRPGRRGEDRRRVHRPHHGGPPLERGAAPGDRGEGRRPDPGGAPDARDDHAPELLPPLRQARRHDRHREDRGEGVRRDLRPERRRDPDQRRCRARRPERPDLQDGRGEVRRRRRRHQGAATRRVSRCSSARSPSRPPSTSASCSSARASRTTS